MPKHDMENIFRKKLEDFEAPHGDRWEQIAAALPPEKKRRGGFWLWFGTGMAVLIGVISVVVVNQTPFDHVSESELTQSNVQPKTQILPLTPSEGGIDPASSEGGIDPAASDGGNGANPSVIANTQVDEPTGILPLTPRLHYVPSGKASKGGIETPLQAPDFAHAPAANSNSNENPEQEPKPQPSEIEFTINADGDTIKVRKQPALKVSDTTINDRKPGYNFAENGKWSMGFGMGIFSSAFVQRMPKTQGNTAIEQQGMVQRNQELRKKMEKPGIAFSQSLWIQFQPHHNWSFNTGISMVQTTQNLAFTIKNQVPDPYRGPTDFPEAGTAGPSGQYLFPEDSILPGNGYTATNNYFSREIPFSVNYHLWLNQKFQLQISAGAAYRWITGASVYFADIDNVGMIYMNGPEYYPGLRSTWNIQGGLALNYQLNEYFSLNMMPSFQLALQSNIRHEHYVQQYQRQWGLQVRLSRKLGF